MLGSDALLLTTCHGRTCYVVYVLDDGFTNLTIQARQSMLDSEVVSVGRYSERVRESGREIKRCLKQEALALGQAGGAPEGQ